VTQSTQRTVTLKDGNLPGTGMFPTSVRKGLGASVERFPSDKTIALITYPINLPRLLLKRGILQSLVAIG